MFNDENTVDSTEPNRDRRRKIHQFFKNAPATHGVGFSMCGDGGRNSRINSDLEILMVGIREEQFYGCNHIKAMKILKAMIVESAMIPVNE